MWRLRLWQSSEDSGFWSAGWNQSSCSGYPVPYRPAPEGCAAEREAETSKTTRLAQVMVSLNESVKERSAVMNS